MPRTTVRSASVSPFTRARYNRDHEVSLYHCYCYWRGETDGSGTRPSYSLSAFCSAKKVFGVTAFFLDQGTATLPQRP